MELFDNPGIIITFDNNVIRTTKIKKYITKKNINYKEIKYLENPSKDFKETERLLKELENNYLGLGPLKEKIIIQDIDFTIYNYYWNNIPGGGWYITKDNADELNKIIYSSGKRNNYVYVGKTENNESQQETIKRLYIEVVKPEYINK